MNAPFLLVDAELVIPELELLDAPPEPPADIVTVAVDKDDADETDDPSDKD